MYNNTLFLGNIHPENMKTTKIDFPKGKKYTGYKNPKFQFAFPPNIRPVL